MPERLTLVVYGASEAADTTLLETARAAQREGTRLSVVALAPVEPENARCCGVSSVYWNGVQRELAESELARARLVVEADDAVDLTVLGHAGLGAAAAIVAWAQTWGPSGSCSPTPRRRDSAAGLAAGYVGSARFPCAVSASALSAVGGQERGG